MNSQERDLLESFLEQLVQAHGLHKVPEADAIIRRALERQPDAAYLLVQRSLIQQQALKDAKARIAQLELAPQEAERSFLDGGSSNTAVATPATAAGRGGWFSQRVAAGAAFPAPENVRGAAGTGSFLGQAAATAAGVAGGAFLFQGIEDLVGSHGPLAEHGARERSPVEDVTVNNYNASDEPHVSEGDEPTEQFADAHEPPEGEAESGNGGGDFV